jgi:chromosome segregation ATPase
MEYMTVEFLLVVGVVLILILLGIIFLIPGEKKGKKMKKKVQENLLEEKKDLEHKVSRLEKHIKSLHDRIVALQKNEKTNEKIMMVERVKVKKLQEKLSQEREWYKKEGNSIEKREKENRQLKAELKTVQESFSKEHTHNIRMEREIKDLKSQNDALNDKRRLTEGENSQLKAKGESDRKEILSLKKEVAQLSKKNEDVQWIAKTEYDRVARLLAQKEKELQRMERELKK